MATLPHLMRRASEIADCIQTTLRPTVLRYCPASFGGRLFAARLNSQRSTCGPSTNAPSNRLGGGRTSRRMGKPSAPKFLQNFAPSTDLSSEAVWAACGLCGCGRRDGFGEYSPERLDPPVLLRLRLIARIQTLIAAAKGLSRTHWALAVIGKTGAWAVEVL